MATNINWPNKKLILHLSKFYRNIFILVVVCVITNSSSLFAQISDKQNNTSDLDMFESIRRSLETKPKFYISFDNRNSFVSNRNSWFFGGKVGLEYQKVFRIGVGFHGLFNKNYSVFINEIKQSNENLYFNYFSFFTEYIFKNHKKYEFSLPINLGIGYSWIGKFKEKQKGQMVLLYEAQLNGMYFPISFFGVGAGLGYRIMLVNNSNIDENFTAPIYSFKIKLILEKLFKQ